MVTENGLEILPCMFVVGVLCSYRKDKRFVVMGRCFKCRHYRRFEREMDEEDEKIMDEIDEIHRTGVWK